MKVCVLGAGGREHAIAWKLKQSTNVSEVFMVGVSGNNDITSVSIDLLDFDAINDFITSREIDLTIVGPEQPLCEGIVDFLSAKGHRVFGPSQNAALLEGSKIFSKQFMTKYDIKTAPYGEFYNYEDALAYSLKFGYPQVIKANGLCAGKGVYICQNQQECQNALSELFLDQIFASSGHQVVIEKFLNGFEVSLLCFVSQDKITPLQTAMDYKKIYENDLGPNTGGVGCVSPNPYWTFFHNQQSDAILRKIEYGLKQEILQYCGILFIGYLVENDEVYVLEFNTRFGDPETEVVLPLLENDLVEVILACLDGKKVDLSFSNQVALTTILVSNGYPKHFTKHHPITINTDALIFHNGTYRKDGQLLSNGGRVLSVVALGESFDKCRDQVYQSINEIYFENMAYRKDIGIFKK